MHQFIYWGALMLLVLLLQVDRQVEGLIRPFSQQPSALSFLQTSTTLSQKGSPSLPRRRLQTAQSSATKRILELAGPTLFIGLQCSSVNTALSILRGKSVGKLSAVPFGSLFVNCLIWTLYGRIKANGSVFYPNLLGVFVGTFCMSMYHEFAQKKPWDLYLVVSLISIVCLGLAQFGKVQAIGLIGCVLSILLSGSPLAVVRTVIRDRSTAALPFTTSFVTWLNNLSWILFGYFIAQDPLIYLPNILGFSLSSIQVALFVIYGFPSNSKKAAEKDILPKDVEEA